MRRISYATLRTGLIEKPLVSLPRETASLEKAASSEFSTQKPARYTVLGPDGVTIRGEGYTILDILLAAITGNGYEQIAIIGDYGSGKSTLASWLLYAVFSALGYEDPWKQAYVHTVFTVEEFDELKEIYRNQGTRAPIVLWDDAGLYLSKYRYGEDQIKSLTDYMQAIREDVAVFLFTMNETEDIVKRIRTKFTGEIFCEKKYVKVGGVTQLIRGRAYFSIRDRMVSYKYFGRTYDRKIIVHGLRGCELIYPPLPPWYEEMYLHRKNEAKRDVDLRRRITAARREAPKLLAALSRIELEILQAIRNLANGESRPVALMEIMRYFKENGKKLSGREIDRRLSILRSCGLILETPLKPNTWKLTEKAIEALEVYEEKNRKLKEELEEATA